MFPSRRGKLQIIGLFHISSTMITKFTYKLVQLKYLEDQLFHSPLPSSNTCCCLLKVGTCEKPEPDRAADQNMVPEQADEVQEEHTGDNKLKSRTNKTPTFSVPILCSMKYKIF